MYRNTASSYVRVGVAEEGEAFGVGALCVLLAACRSCQLLSENIHRAYGQSILIIPEGVSNSGARPSAPLTYDQSKNIQPLIYLELEAAGEQDLVLIGRVSTQSIPEAESPRLCVYTFAWRRVVLTLASVLLSRVFQIDKQQFEETVRTLNNLYAEAEKLGSQSYIEGCLACLTAYTVFLCMETHYEKVRGFSQ